MIETVFQTVTGLKFTQGNIIGLVLFFGLGYVFGKLTRRVGIIKGFFAVIFGLYFYSALKDTYGVVILAFLLGVIANHSYLYIELFRWAQSIGDVFFALRHRRAYEEMRRREADFDAQVRKARAEAYSSARKGGETSQQKRWRADSSPSGGSNSSGGSRTYGHANQSRASPRSNSSNTHNGLKSEYLRTLGLDPLGEFTVEELKKAYRQQAKRVHPDAGGTPQAFRDLTSRYEWLRANFT